MPSRLVGQLRESEILREPSIPRDVLTSLFEITKHCVREGQLKVGEALPDPVSLVSSEGQGVG
jgi:hypothetical protein